MSKHQGINNPHQPLTQPKMTYVEVEETTRAVYSISFLTDFFKSTLFIVISNISVA